MRTDQQPKRGNVQNFKRITGLPPWMACAYEMRRVVIGSNGPVTLGASLAVTKQQMADCRHDVARALRRARWLLRKEVEAYTDAATDRGN